jgi:Pyruvate/2-oxoacid:ferredoxin oxidoreductase delta subunit
MDEIYRRLAARLDEFPQGYPATETGVELAILRKIFTPDEAALACALPRLPQSAEAIARRLGRPLEPLRADLDRMVERGQLLVSARNGRRRYALLPFVVGIYEFQLPRMDAELAELFEAYAPALSRGIGGAGPALGRVVPVNAHIEARAEVLAHDRVRALLADAVSFRLMECVCRRERAALGHPCSHTLETCLSFSRQESAAEMAWWGHEITREEAFAVLDRCEREGLVHCTYNVRRDSMFVCNCCTCCCGFLRGVREFEAPHLLLRSNYLAAIDDDACSDCGDCAGRCPMDAIAGTDGSRRVDAERCIGCGVCTVACPTEAVTLRERPPQERTTPPRDLLAWAYRRSAARVGPWRTLAQFGGLAVDALRRSPRRTT